MRKRLLCLFLILCLCLAMMPCVYASGFIDSGYCGENGGDNLEWRLASDGTLTIEGTGKMEDYNTWTWRPPWYKYRDQIKALVFGPGSEITKIGICAFTDCRYLASELVIPSTVCEIGGSAFSGCKRMTGSIVIPSGMTRIASSVFSGCESLNGTLTIPPQRDRHRGSSIPWLQQLKRRIDHSKQCNKN